jgi:hypothetical protein
MRDDPGTNQLQPLPCLVWQLGSLGMPEQDQRLLGDVELARIDQDFRRGGKALRTASRCTRPKPACSGAGREVQISQWRSSNMRRIRSISRAQRSAASGRYSVDPNASSAMNTCRRSASNARQISSAVRQLSGGGALIVRSRRGAAAGERIRADASLSPCAQARGATPPSNSNNAAHTCSK